MGFLAESLRAADWAAANIDEVRAVLQTETQSGPEGVVAAYGENFHTGLHLSLSDERVDLLGVQKQFLYAHGFLAADFDLQSWVAHEPLEQARNLVAQKGTAE